MTGEEFAQLYDEHERAVYNFCLRLTGSPDDAADATQETFARVLERLPKLDERELNFGAYLMTVARHASYDALARRRRAMPSEHLPESAAPVAEAPESQVLRGAHQEQIRAASLALPPRQREVLALRELAELSYDQVAEVMGMNRNSVAQLISRARLNLRDGLRHTALGSVASASPLCDRALPLLAMRQDGVLEDEAGWLTEHLAGCGTCRVRMEAMEEAAVAYRLWLPVAAAAWLRDAAVAEAAERLSAGHELARAGRGAARRPRALAGAGLAAGVLVTLGLLAADAQSPTRVLAPAATGTPAVTPEPAPVVRRATWTTRAKVKPRRAKLHDIARDPAPVVVAGEIAPAPTVVVPEAPAPRVAPRRRVPKAPSHEAALPEPTATPEPTPTPTPDPTPTPEPPPPPPQDDPEPPPPTRPNGPDGFTAPQPPPVP